MTRNISSIALNWLNQRSCKINVATTSKDIEVLKCKHIKDYYKYLCKLSSTLWAVLVYDNTDENQTYECVYFSYNEALYAYNHYNGERNE